MLVPMLTGSAAKALGQRVHWDAMRCHVQIARRLKPFDVVFHGRPKEPEVKPVPKPPEVPKSAWEPRTVFRPTASIKRLRTVRK